MNIVEVKDVTIKVKDETLYENLTFNVKAGSITGLLGNNGVGKTLLLKKLANIENVPYGQVKINGIENNMEVFRNDVVYIPDNVILLLDKTIKENIELITYNREYDIEFINRYLKKFNLEQKDIVGKLSKGNKEMVQLIIFLSIESTLVILDEPFSAVDVFRRECILEMMLERINEQNAFIITTHLINELEPIIDHILYINDKKLALDVDADEIQNSEIYTSLVDYLKINYGEVIEYV